MGSGEGTIRWFVLEVHYDNPNRETGHVDESGVRIYFTKHLRENDAGTLMLGNIGNNEPDIPPKLNSYHVEANCPSECTQQWEHSINVFADTQHMHQVGNMVWSTVHRDGKQLPDLSRIEYWDFNFQDSFSINRVLHPGDRINTNCIYNTTSKTTPTRFGSASSDEMCLEFLMYYPLLRVNGRQFSRCGSTRGQQHRYPDGRIVTSDPNKFRTRCDGITTVWDPENNTVINPDIRDPPGGEVRTFAVKPPVCNPSTGMNNNENIFIAVGVTVVVAAMVFVGFSISNGLMSSN